MGYAHGRSMFARTFAAIAAACLALSLQLTAQAAGPDSPIASKDGVTYSLEDLSIYFLRNLGKDGLLDFFQAMVIYQEGLKQGLKPTEQEITDFINKTMSPAVYAQFKQLFSDKSVRTLVEYTIVEGRYEAWLRNKVKKDKNVTVTEQEANQFFLKNIDQFQLPEGVALSIISVDNENQAKAVLDRLKKGENFNDLAGEVNMDAEMRAAKGQLGTYRKGDGLPDPLEKAAFGLTEGAFSEVIKGTNFHIVFCSRRYAEVTPTFPDVKDDLMNNILESKIDPFYLDEMDALMAREMPKFRVLAELFKPEAGSGATAAPGP